MCGRISQYRRRLEYASAIGWPVDEPGGYPSKLYGSDRNPRYNVPPGTWPDVMHTLDPGERHFDTVGWGYQAPAKEGRPAPPFVINARLETAATRPYFRHMFREGRVIVPADGWYEWTGEKGDKQPWFIRLKDGGPAFLAAITNWKPYTVQHKQTGFVIVTAEATGGMVDVHDRRPVVLAPADARMWMDNSLPVEQADALARHHAVPAEAFEWFKVTRQVNKPGNDGPEMVEPIG